MRATDRAREVLDGEIRFVATITGRAPGAIAIETRWNVVGIVLDALRDRKVKAIVEMTKRRYTASVLYRSRWYSATHARPDTAIVRAAMRALDRATGGADA